MLWYKWSHPYLEGNKNSNYGCVNLENAWRHIHCVQVIYLLEWAWSQAHCHSARVSAVRRPSSRVVARQGCSGGSQAPLGIAGFLHSWLTSAYAICAWWCVWVWVCVGVGVGVWGGGEG